MRRIGISIFVFLIFLLLAGNSAFAWTIDGSKYGYAQFATNNATIQFPTSINGTYGVCNETIWANVSIADTDGLFKKATGCGGSKLISDGFTQLCWENESDINGGNCRTQIWDSEGAFAVYHLTNDKDSSKYANNLTLVNSPVHVKGLFGDALNYSNNFSMGSNQYAHAGDLPIKPLNNMSITAWIWAADNASIDTDYRTIISQPRGYPSPASFNMNIWFAIPDTKNLRIVCRMYDGSSHYAYSNQVIYPNTWYYATCGHNGTNVVVSVNDNFAMFSTATIGNISYTSDNLLIGALGNSSYYFYFNGIIDEPRLYSRFLSQQERLEKYQEGLDKINSLQSEMSQLPNVTINYPPDGTLFTNGTVTIGFTPELAINITLWGNFSGTWGMNQTNQTAATIMTTLPDGVYSINLQACDGTDCVFATANRTIIVAYDHIPPAIFPSAPYNATYMGGDNIPFNLTLNEIGSTCLVDFGFGNFTMTNSSGNWHFSTTIYVGGTYIPIFSCNDTNGNMNTTAGNTFTVVQTNATFNVKNIFDSHISGVNISCNNSYVDYGLDSPFSHEFIIGFFYFCGFEASGYYVNYSTFETVNPAQEVNVTLPLIPTNITFNVKNPYGVHLSGLNISCNNSYSDNGLNSPFIHAFATGYYFNCTFSKSSYYNNYSIFSTEGVGKEINLTLSAISSPTPPIIDPSSITGQLVLTLGFGIMGLFAVLTLLGFGYLESTGKPDPETIAKIMIGVVIIILMIVAVWTGIVTPP